MANEPSSSGARMPLRSRISGSSGQPRTYVQVNPWFRCGNVWLGSGRLARKKKREYAQRVRSTLANWAYDASLHLKSHTPRPGGQRGGLCRFWGFHQLPEISNELLPQADNRISGFSPGVYGDETRNSFRIALSTLREADWTRTTFAEPLVLFEPSPRYLTATGRWGERSTA